MRLIFACLILLGAAQLGALETSLVLRPPTGGDATMAMVNPAQGTIQLYRIDGEQLHVVSRRNFRADLEYLSSVPPGPKLDWTLLRTGSTTCTPTYGEVMDQWLPAIDKAAEAARKRSRDKNTPPPLPLAQRAMNSEDDFWKQTPEYDGVVRGSMSQNALVLLIPQTYTMLFYQIQNWEIQFMGWRNYRTDLYVPQTFQSTPTPQELLTLLPKEIQDERKEALAQQMEEIGETAGETIPLAPSDPWITSYNLGTRELFVILDPPNNRLIMYQFRTRGKMSMLELQSVRNIEIDLMIPTTFNSEPDLRNVIVQYNKVLQKQRMPPVDGDYISGLVGGNAVAAQVGSEVHANIDAEGMLFIDFTGKRKILVYRMAGNQVELLAARDYTIEVGIALHQQELQLRAKGIEVFKLIEKTADKDTVDACMRLMEIALRWNPWLYEEFEGDRKLRRTLENHERWGPLIEQAINEVNRLEQREKELREKAQ